MNHRTYISALEALICHILMYLRITADQIYLLFYYCMVYSTFGCMASLGKSNENMVDCLNLTTETEGIHQQKFRTVRRFFTGACEGLGS